ncbi:MAG: hypothetical protein ATN35_09365 [Epulopiscium sp. Nele67-Bin004]|nr:MAG: hypothetical protein ATN35_09365 [Epulopiscium sp. Nele67-Bin004]
MKSLFVIILIFKQVGDIPMQKKDREQLYFLKCLAYLFLSSVSSTLFTYTVPLGAILMFILYLIDDANKVVKLKMILTGLIIVILSSISFNTFSDPLQNLYLSEQTSNIIRIDAYSYTPEYEQFLFAISEEEQVEEWISLLLKSQPVSYWNYKSIPKSIGYRLRLYSADHSIDIIVSNQQLNSQNLYVGDQYTGYYNEDILELIESVHPATPYVLTINASTDAVININNSTILHTLWQKIIWSSKDDVANYSLDNFSVSAYLFFESNLGCRLFFTTDFHFAYIQDQGVIALPSSLQKMLYEQFILSQLETVDMFRDFAPTHISNSIPSSIDFHISPDEDNFFYGLYRSDYKAGETIFLHTVTSLDSKFFELKAPYLLLLDQKGPSQYDLMLVNQNIPESHRYMVKNANINPSSIAICPQNTTFAYITDNDELSTLFYVSNYYQSPKTIVSGKIYDCVFLSDKYIAFTQEIDDINLLCVYDTQLKKIVKYTYIPGDIHFVDSYNNQILFTVQSIDNLELKEGLFILNSDLSIQPSDFDDISLTN